MQNNNSVCFLAIINEVIPIAGADKIEQAIIGGWSCVVQKDAYVPGELIAIATTDAVIPPDLAKELQVENYLRKGSRVRTVKLRGVYSECLVIPYHIVKNRVKNTSFENKILEKGVDLMEAMGVFKYDPPPVMIQLSSGKKIRYSKNPNFPIYYKFPNEKNVPDMFNNDDTVEVTRKLHGTNARYGIVKKNKITLWDKVKKLFGNKFIEYEFVVGSHNVEKGSDSQGFYDTNVWFDINNIYLIENRLWDYVKRKYTNNLESLGDGLIVYGEIYGTGIQKNYDYGIGGLEFRIFDIILNGEYLDTQSVRLLGNTEIGLPYVPILYTGKYNREIINKFVFNNFIEGTKVPHEGVVVKCISGDRKKIAKIINPDYLIYGEKHNIGDSH